MAARVNGGRSLIVSTDGLAHDSKKSQWQVSWRELRRLVITMAYHQNTTMLASKKVWRVRLILDVTDPGFLQRHPQLAKGEGKFGGTGPGSFGIPLGPVENLVDPLVHAFTTFAAPIFGGVINEGQAVGFGYL